MIRTGIGYDVHQLVKNRPLIIGGITIPSPVGSLGYSDGDVLLHALVDALLGAVALGDIGTLFPSSEQQWKDADSRIFLETAVEKVKSAGYTIVNIDSIVILQKPELAQHITAMRENIADILGVAVGRVAVKATTTDYLGFTGRGEGLAAQAIATITRE